MHGQALGIAELARICREEAARYRRGQASDDRACYELFRRAITGRDDPAWEAIVAQYRGVVLAWVRQHPASSSLQEEDDFWVGRTFQRFWMALGPEKFNFPELAAVLRYLKMCAHSVLLDEVRSRSAARFEELPEDEEHHEQLRIEMEGPTLDKLAVGELWRAIERELTDEPMRLACYLSFALGLKPSQMHERHPEHYPTVADAYRIKRNALDRLRRSDQIRAFLGDEPQNHQNDRSFHG